MQWGIFALIDVLGFKGMWRRGHTPDDIFAALSRIRALADHLSDDQMTMDGGDLWSDLKIDVRVFSDNVILSCHLPDGRDQVKHLPGYEETRRYMLLRYIVLLMSKVVTEAASGPVPLLYRGCIAGAEYSINENPFAYLGPAVDEAGALFEAADGFFVFLAPSASEVYRGRPGLLRRAMFPYFVTYDIPLKDAPPLKTFALNPLLFTREEYRAELKDRIMGTFEVNKLTPDISSKRDNTRRFLDFLGAGWLPPSLTI